MAIDSQSTRMSIIGLNVPMPSLFPSPDGVISNFDRAHLLWLYSGTAIFRIRKAVESTVYLYDRTIGVRI